MASALETYEEVNRILGGGGEINIKDIETLEMDEILASALEVYEETRRMQEDGVDLRRQSRLLKEIGKFKWVLDWPILTFRYGLYRLYIWLLNRTVLLHAAGVRNNRFGVILGQRGDGEDYVMTSYSLEVRGKATL